MRYFQDKKITLGVCGGIAAYKVADWVRELRRVGAGVTVIMTREAARFVTPLTFAALSSHRVHGDMFEYDEAASIPHISLGRECDLVLVAPATAQTIARLAHGMADDLLAAVILASRRPVVLCPAMNTNMYLHPATQRNLETCRAYGYHIIDPESGTMACNEEGPGRLAPWATVRESLAALFAPQDLTGRNVLITAGPTREVIDAARILTNRSSGKMGYALARAARQRGARVTLVSGPVRIPPPAGVECIQVATALEMHAAVMERARLASVIIKAAAVSDFRVAAPSTHKIKKTEAATTLTLTGNPDILLELGVMKQGSSHPFPLLVGFAAQSEKHLEEGVRKLKEKHADLMVVNDILGADQGFEAETNKVTLLDRDGMTEEFPLLSKEETAHRILNAVVRLLQA